MLALIIFIILVALAFDFLNGFHDATNSIATVVCTRVLSPVQAVIWAAFFNFVAAFVFGTHVADTVGKGLIQVSAVDMYVVLAGLSGAIAFDPAGNTLGDTHLIRIASAGKPPVP